MTFQMFGPIHIVFMILPFIITAITYFLTKNKSEDTKYKIGFWLSVFATIVLLARNIEIFILDGYKISNEIIPLQICHFANFVLIYAFWKRSQSAFALAFCLNLPAAFLSIIFANSLTRYATILTVRGFSYIIGHALIVAITIYALLTNLIKIDKKVFLKTLKVMTILYAIAIISNNLFQAININANYFYSLRPEKGTPLEWFYNWGRSYKLGFFEINPIYLISTGIFGVFVVFVFYKLYQFIMKFVDKDWQKQSYLS